MITIVIMIIIKIATVAADNKYTDQDSDRNNKGGGSNNSRSSNKRNTFNTSPKAPFPNHFKTSNSF